MSTQYNPIAIMDMMKKAHIDAIPTANHPHSDHPVTTRISYQFSKDGVTDPMEMMKRIAPHVNALNDPSHPEANSEFTAYLRNLVDAYHAADPTLGLKGPTATSPVNPAGPAGAMPAAMNPALFQAIRSSSGSAPVAGGSTLEGLRNAMSTMGNKGPM